MIILANENASGGFAEDAYMSALENAQFATVEAWPEINGWLKENMDDRYEIKDDYSQNGLDVNCIMYIEFDSPTDEMAFKLRWM